ncbi:hypothetical protein [Escherichia coli]|nr:hypothetical protein [Escherichia coli]MCZ0535697.1 hypothetical protein [Escherichia coli]
MLRNRARRLDYEIMR